MRNAQKDELEMQERRKRMLSAGFRLFSEQGIEAVTMQMVAQEAGLGVATLYRYYNTKLAFAIAIAVRNWTDYYEEVEREYQARGGGRMTAAEELDFYLGSYISLYRAHRDVLRFHQNISGFIAHEQVAPEQLRDYRASVELYARKFHLLYERGKKDGTIRTDMPETQMFVSTMHIMLAVAARFAEGVAYGADGPEDLTAELMLLKRILLTRFIPQ